MGRAKLLLTAVFGPYGVKTRYAESLGMQMELLNNQITRMQGVHSPRQSYWTFPLYLLAENIPVETTVLDFPSWRDFAKELRNGYTHVGINFIVPNVLKAKRMAEYVRERHPEMTIILGGAGTVIPELREIVPCDEICKGEGVGWLRAYFGGDLSAPVRHPAIIGPAYEYLYGAKGKPKGAILMPGVGCDNGCRFCSTSHQFGKSYHALLPTGQSLFDACRKTEAELGSRGFTIIDENFLKKPERARELLALMTRHDKPYVFDIFSSAEVIKKMGSDFLVRLGVRMIWIGVESRVAYHDKVRGIDIPALVAELQSKGISVNASTILFHDHHDEKTIREDIDYAIGLGSNFLQFMNYTPLPGTALHGEMTAEGRMKDLPYRYVTGAGELSFVHPHFNDRKDHVNYLRDAFRRKYLADGPGVLNMAVTSIRGYSRAVRDYGYRQKNSLSWDPDQCRYVPSAHADSDEFMLRRLRMMRKIAENIRPILVPALVFAPNRAARRKALAAMGEYRSVLGPASIGQRIVSAVLVVTAAVEWLRIQASRLSGREGIVHQPTCRTTLYPSRELRAERERAFRALGRPGQAPELAASLPGR